jgi:hypothetical protein
MTIPVSIKKLLNVNTSYQFIQYLKQLNQESLENFKKKNKDQALGADEQLPEVINILIKLLQDKSLTELLQLLKDIKRLQKVSNRLVVIKTLPEYSDKIEDCSIVTPQGLFQINPATNDFVKILPEDELESLDLLKALVTAAKNADEIIEVDPDRAPGFMVKLNALLMKKGHDIVGYAGEDPGQIEYIATHFVESVTHIISNKVEIILNQYRQIARGNEETIDQLIIKLNNQGVFTKKEETFIQKAEYITTYNKYRQILAMEQKETKIILANMKALDDPDRDLDDTLHQQIAVFKEAKEAILQEEKAEKGVLLLLKQCDKYMEYLGDLKPNAKPIVRKDADKAEYHGISEKEVIVDQIREILNGHNSGRGKLSAVQELLIEQNQLKIIEKSDSWGEWFVKGVQIILNYCLGEGKAPLIWESKWKQLEREIQPDENEENIVSDEYNSQLWKWN